MQASDNYVDVSEVVEAIACVIASQTDREYIAMVSSLDVESPLPPPPLLLLAVPSAVAAVVAAATAAAPRKAGVS